MHIVIIITIIIITIIIITIIIITVLVNICSMLAIQVRSYVTFLFIANSELAI